MNTGKWKGLASLIPKGEASVNQGIHPKGRMFLFSANTKAQASLALGILKQGLASLIPMREASVNQGIHLKGRMFLFLVDRMLRRAWHPCPQEIKMPRYAGHLD